MLWQWRTRQNFKTNWLVQNWHEEFNKFWPEHSKTSKMCPLLGWFWLKYIILQLRKLRGVMFDGSEYWFKIWRKTDFFFQKWHGEFGKFSPEHLKVSKLGLWWDSFIQSRKCISLKFTGEFFVMTRKKDAKLEGELICCFKIDMYILMGSFWSKYIMFELKKCRSYIWWHWRLIQNLKEGWSVLSKTTWRVCQTFIHRLKNSDFILESKMAELNQNKNSKKLYRPYVALKLYFTLEMNE